MHRTLLVLSLACLTSSLSVAKDVAVATRPPRPEAEAGVEAQIVALEQRVGGRIGFFALDTASGRSIEHRAHERFAMCSTFKWLLAAEVLSNALGSRPDFSLEKRIAYGEADLLGHAPRAREHLKEGAMSVGALVDAAVEVSDNTAANLLLALVGGPSGLTAWLRQMGDQDTRLDRSELSLNTNLPGDARDTTTPAASAGDLQQMLLEKSLPPLATERLKAAMERSQTGGTRLRAGLPSDWRVADKTGTCGERGAVNDVAVIWPKGRSPLVVAAYLSDSAASVETLEAAHAELARITAQAWVMEPPRAR
jgi:beta-lactamase class A